MTLVLVGFGLVLIAFAGWLVVVTVGEARELSRSRRRP